MTDARSNGASRDPADLHRRLFADAPAREHVERDLDGRAIRWCACRTPVPNGAYLGERQCRCLCVIESRRPWTPQNGAGRP